MPALINTQSDGGRGKPSDTLSSGSDEASPSLSGGLVPLMGGEDRPLLFAATGLRVGGEGKLMAAWLDKGEDERRGGGIEVEKVKQREREGERDEREGGSEEDSLPV